MKPAENTKENLVKKPKKKALKIIIGAIAAVLLILILAIVFAVPAYVSSDSGKRFILAKANASGAGAIDFANLSMSWAKGISISRLSFRDKAESMSVMVLGFSTKPKYAALFMGNLSLGETLVDEPKIEINVDKMKRAKQESAEKQQPGTKTGAQAGLPIGRIDLVVRNGDVKIKSAAGAVEVSQINSSVDLRPEGQKSDFNVGAKIVGGGSASTINAKGEVKPGSGWDLKKTSGNVTVEVNNLDLTSLESILAIAGVEVSARGVVSANLKGSMKDGMIETITGQVQGKALDISAPALKGDRVKTNMLDADVSAARAGDLMNVEKLTVQTDWLKADANGAAPTSLGSLEDFLKPGSKYELRANLECDIPAITKQLPATLGLKEGMRVTGGKVVGSVQTLTEDGTKKLSGQVSVDGLAGTYNGKPVSISEPIVAQALITTDGKVIKFEKMGVTSAFAGVNCTGTTEAFSYVAQVDLARLTSELGEFADLSKYKPAGQVASKGQITNNKNTAMIVGSADIANLRVSPTADVTITEPNASLEVVAALDKAKQVLLIKQFKAATTLGQFSVKDGKVPVSKESKEPMLLTAAARGVDLAKVQPYLVMTKAISKDVQLAGIADSDVTVGYKDGSYKLKTESTKITNLMIKSPDRQPFTQDSVALVLDADVNPEAKNWSLETEVTGTNIKIKGSFKQNTEDQTSDMQGNAQLDYDWKVLSGMLSAFMPGGLVVEGKRKDTINFSSRYPAKDPNQMLANLDAQAKVGFDRAGYMGLNIGATNVDIKVDRGLLTIPPFTTTVNNGQFNFGGTADFKKKPAMFRTPQAMRIIKDVQLNDEIANKLLAKINPVFSGALSVSGIANFDCNSMAMPISGGRGEDADIVGIVSLTNVKMQPTGLLGMLLTATGAGRGETMMIHPTPFVVKNGFVRYENMQMDIGNMPVNFAGSVPVDPDRQIENFSVTLPVTAAGEIIKIGKETTGTQPQRITAHIKGTPNHPQLDLGKIVQDQLIEKGLEMLMEKPKKKK